MQAIMKTQTTGSLAEICLTIPANELGRVSEAIRGVMALTGHRVRRVNADGEELYTVAEVFPEGGPAMALRGLRGKEDLTQAEMATRLGISQTRISELESGKRAISVDMAKRIGKEFTVSYKVFL